MGSRLGLERAQRIGLDMARVNDALSTKIARVPAFDPRDETLFDPGNKRRRGGYAHDEHRPIFPNGQLPERRRARHAKAADQRLPIGNQLGRIGYPEERPPENEDDDGVTVSFPTEATFELQDNGGKWEINESSVKTKFDTSGFY